MVRPLACIRLPMRLARSRWWSELAFSAAGSLAQLNVTHGYAAPRSEWKVSRLTAQCFGGRSVLRTIPWSRTWKAFRGQVTAAVPHSFYATARHVWQESRPARLIRPTAREDTESTKDTPESPTSAHGSKRQ